MGTVGVLLAAANRTGTRSAFTRSPMTEQRRSSVREAATATSTTAIAPAPMLRKMVVGFSSNPASASTTVIPEKNTARLAVPPARDRGQLVAAAGALLAVARRR